MTLTCSVLCCACSLHSLSWSAEPEHRPVLRLLKAFCRDKRFTLSTTSASDAGMTLARPHKVSAFCVGAVTAGAAYVSTKVRLMLFLARPSFAEGLRARLHCSAWCGPPSLTRTVAPPASQHQWR